MSAGSAFLCIGIDIFAAVMLKCTSISAEDHGTSGGFTVGLYRAILGLKKRAKDMMSPTQFWNVVKDSVCSGNGVK